MKNRIKSILEKIDAVISRIPLDFTLHVIVSAVMSWFVMIICGMCGLDLLQSSLLGLIVSLTVGVFKETVIDAMLKETRADIIDLCADVTGAAMGVVITLSGALTFN